MQMTSLVSWAFSCPSGRVVWNMFVVCAAFCLLAPAAPQANAGIVDELLSNENVVDAPDGAIEILVKAARPNGLMYALHPGGRHLAVLSEQREADLITLRVLDLLSRERTELYRWRAPGNGFKAAALIWAPDARLVWAEFELPNGHAEWFAFDIGRADLMAEHRQRFEYLANLKDPGEDLELKPLNGQMREAQAPVWGVSGKFYESYVAANREGIYSFLPTTHPGLRPRNLPEILWWDDKPVLCLSANLGSRRIYLVHDDNLLGAVDTAGPLRRGYWFFNIDGELVVKRQFVRYLAGDNDADQEGPRRQASILAVRLGSDARIAALYELERALLLHLRTPDGQRLALLHKPAFSQWGMAQVWAGSKERAAPAGAPDHPDDGGR